jgi:hypothetical protein
MLKRILYPGILLTLIACCNIFNFGEKQSSNSCPNLANLSGLADQSYIVHGKIAVDTLTDSFCPLSVGNIWEYEYTIYQTDIESGSLTSTCGNLSFQVIENSSVMAIIKVGTGPAALFDTLQITDDSIVNRDPITTLIFVTNPFPIQLPYLVPVLIGPRKNLYPCFKFDDSSGYSYANNAVAVYFNKYGLTYLDYYPSKLIDETTYEYSLLLQSFNGTALNPIQHVYECLAKSNYFFINPDSIITSSLNETSPAKLFEGVIFPFDLRSGFAFWNQSCPKTPSLSIVQKKS